MHSLLQDEPVVGPLIRSDSGFEIVTLLPDFTSLTKRSGELDGNLPVRAARYCGPVFEGSSAGFQIVLAQPINVARSRRGDVVCTMTDPALKQVTEEVNDALERGIQAGLIARRGYWHRLFKDNALPTRGRRLVLWTGHMIRPSPGIWALVGGAFNRRSRVSVVDHLVTDESGFVPLVVEIDARDLGREPAWLESEIGCVTPLVPRVRMRKDPLRAGAPELQLFAEFFSEAYFETKARHPTAHYIRREREVRAKAADTCEAGLLYIGPDVHEVRQFDRFIGKEGFGKEPSSPGVLEFGVVRNIAPTRWTWQGQTHSEFEIRNDRNARALETIWRDTFGDRHPSGLEFLRAHLLGEFWDQPYVQYQPWVFAPTSQGWSSLVDGYHRSPAYDGMRGVIGTDWFFILSMVFRIYGPSKATIPLRAPMLRTIPIPRAALALGMASSSL